MTLKVTPVNISPLIRVGFVAWARVSQAWHTHSLTVEDLIDLFADVAKHVAREQGILNSVVLMDDVGKMKHFEETGSGS